MRGNCYVTCEALYHLMGGKRSQWKPMQMRWEGDSHWFLLHKMSGVVLDPTVAQFRKTPRYDQGVGRGFRTQQPSKRAEVLMTRMLWSRAA